MISLFLCPFIYFISLCTASIGSASGIPSAGMPTEFNHVCTFKDVAKLLILGTISCFSLSFDVREFSKRENLNLINVPREFLCFLRFCVLLFILLVLEQLLLEMILEPLPLAFQQDFSTCAFLKMSPNCFAIYLPHCGFPVVLTWRWGRELGRGMAVTVSRALTRLIEFKIRFVGLSQLALQIEIKTKRDIWFGWQQAD